MRSSEDESGPGEILDVKCVKCVKGMDRITYCSCRDLQETSANESQMRICIISRESQRLSCMEEKKLEVREEMRVL